MYAINSKNISIECFREHKQLNLDLFDQKCYNSFVEQTRCIPSYIFNLLPNYSNKLTLWNKVKRLKAKLKKIFIFWQIIKHNVLQYHVRWSINVFFFLFFSFSLDIFFAYKRKRKSRFCDWISMYECFLLLIKENESWKNACTIYMYIQWVHACKLPSFNF